MTNNTSKGAIMCGKYGHKLGDNQCPENKYEKIKEIRKQKSKKK